jgi:hypothetical protein
MRQRAAAPDFPVLEPLAGPGLDAPWTACTGTVHRRAASALARPRRFEPLLPLLPAAAPGADDEPAPATGWQEVVHHLGAAVSHLARWLDADPTPGPTIFGGPSGRSLTDGWPHRGSTVMRHIWAPAEVVAAVIAERERWDGLRLTGERFAPMPYEAGWTTDGRLALPWNAVSVHVELPITVAAGGRTWANLVLKSWGRHPRQYWTGGHEALAAIDASARRRAA